jgi:ribosomal protein L7/L12
MVKDKRDITSEATAALARGDKIEAIKFIRIAYGVSLLEAKEIVEQNEKRTEPQSRQREHKQDLPNEAISALQQGSKIAAIKSVRVAYGIGLKESKELVELFLELHPAIMEKLAAENAKKLKTLLNKALVIIFIGIAVYYYFGM